MSLENEELNKMSIDLLLAGLKGIISNNKYKTVSFNVVCSEEAPQNSSLSSTNTESVSASQINHTLKNIKSDTERLDFIAEFLHDICIHCGQVTTLCYCMRDD